jgi:hypothetical protein
MTPIQKTTGFNCLFNQPGSIFFRHQRFIEHDGAYYPQYARREYNHRDPHGQKPNDGQPEINQRFLCKYCPLIRGIPRAFIVNLDESDFSDYPDARRETVVVHADNSGDTIPIPFDRNTKWATMVAVIAADGAGLKPLIIVSCKAIEVELILWDVRHSKSDFDYQENGFMTIKLFEKWVGAFLMPYFSVVRMCTGDNGPTIVISDGCTCHAIERIQVALQAKRIYLAPLPPHSSDAWQRATIPRVTVAAFRAAGFVPIERDGEIYVEVDLAQAQRIRHWTERPHIEDVVSAAGLSRLRLAAETREYKPSLSTSSNSSKILRISR